MDDACERRCLVALHLTPVLGAVRIAQLVQALGSAAAAWSAPEDVLAGVSGIGPRMAAAIVRGRAGVDVDRELRRAQTVGARILTWLDAGYPAGLRGLRNAPPVVYLRGEWCAGAQLAVAVVGTRRASAYGLGIARALGEALGSADVVVVSGLARGIDGAAHAGALRAAGATVGVLGCGVDVVYPAEHRSLMEAMLRRGAVIAEVPMGTPPRPQQFPPRNRLISALARAVVVVEGDVDSGAVITARYAVAQGRQVFAVPGSVYAPASRGPHRLLAEGARVLATPGDLLEVLGLPRASGSMPATPIGSITGDPQGLSAGEARVLAALASLTPLEGQTCAIDQIIAAAGLEPARVTAALAALEVRGLARQISGKRFARRVGTFAEEDAGGATWPNHSSS